MFALIHTDHQPQVWRRAGREVDVHRAMAFLTSDSAMDLESVHRIAYSKSVKSEKIEQEKLSGVVKNVHRKLRRKYVEGKLR